MTTDVGAVIDRALLLQAHGFEALGSVAAESPTKDLPVAKRHDRRGRRLNLDAVSTLQARSVRHDHVVAMLDELFWHDDYPLERLAWM